MNKMSAEINYKNKYMELRSKYMNDLDMAFRLGMEQGAMQAQQDQMAQQQAEAQQMQQAALQAQGQPGQEGAGGPPQEGAPQGQEAQEPDMNGQNESELDQHIAKLEGMVSSPGAGANPEIQKSLQELISLRKKELEKIKFDREMKKSEKAISGIAKALHKPPFKLSKVAAHNLSSNAKSAVSLQHKIVNDVMAKMEAEEKRATKSISDILDIEGLTKG
jgi:hypothetical protein